LGSLGAGAAVVWDAAATTVLVDDCAAAGTAFGADDDPHAVVVRVSATAAMPAAT
jgi:hypothetical protein